MELKDYIKATAKVIIPSIDHLQLVEYKGKELDFVYGMQEYHTSFRKMFKQIKRILWR
jgi:Zn-finger domain-containing protein